MRIRATCRIAHRLTERAFLAAAVGLCAIAAIGLCASAALASPVTVLQAEADASSTDAGHQYAAVDFAGSSSVVVDGVTYYALSETGSSTQSTYSWHAAIVRDRLLAADGPSNPVTNIYCLAADDFLNNYVQTDYASTTAAAPLALGNNIKVINNSWVTSYNDPAGDLDAVRRLDYMIWREDLVMVSGAVSPLDGVQTPVAWASRNGLAVRGTQGFDPTNAAGIGKTHADLWGPKAGNVDDASSYETPGVAGYAAALVSAADAKGWSNGTNGLRHEVVKSILMTGADKTAFTPPSGAGFHAWTSNGVNNLDNANGAGRTDYSASLTVLGGGPQTMAAVSSGTVTAPTVTTAAAGWWYEPSLSRFNSKALVIDHTGGALSDLTATLAWDVTQKEVSGGLINTTDSGVQFANLDLELLPVTYSGGAYTLGTSLGIAGLVSASTDDNLEHLYFDGALPAGYYALVVSNRSSFAWNYGLSYKFATSLTWLSAGDGAWENAANWTGGTATPVAVDTAVFDGSGTALTVTPDVNRKVKNILFDTAAAGPYVIGAAAGNTLTLTSGGTVQVGAAVVAPQTINAPLVIASTTAGASGTYGFANNAATAAATLNFGGPIAGFATPGNTTVLTLGGANTGANTISGVLGNGIAGGALGIAKTGAGAWILSGANTYTGPTTVAGGTLQLNLPAHAAVLSGGTDIQAGKLVFDYTGGSSPAATIAGLLTTSYASGAWNTGTFRSTTADSTHGLGWLDDGASQVKVAYTFYGDTDLNGTVNSADLAKVLANYNMTGMTWNQGDFDYNGTVNSADLAKVLANYNLALPDPGISGAVNVSPTSYANLDGAAFQMLSDNRLAISVVPEPSTLALLLTGLAGVAGWRRKSVRRSGCA